MSTPVLKPSKSLEVLLTLMLISTTLPIFCGYSFGFFILCWIVREHVLGHLSIKNYLKGRLPRGIFQAEYAKVDGNPPPLGEDSHIDGEKIIGFALKGMYFLFFGMVVASCINQISSPYAQYWTKTLHELAHQMAKQLLLGIVSLIGFFEFYRRGSNLETLSKWFMIWMVVHTIYCLVQHYTGIDFTHGFAARLGEHRYAYGVYRISGFMSHPLTLTYNLLMIFLGSVPLAISSYQRRLPSFRDWATIAGLALVTIVISGSRFVLIVLILVPLLCELPVLFRHWKRVLAVLFVVAMVLGLEKSTLSRVLEFFQGDQPLTTRFPRLLFWQAYVQIFLDFPLAGASLSGIKTAAAIYYQKLQISEKIFSAHNIFLQFLGDCGLVGFFGLITFFSYYFKSALLVYRSKGSHSGLSYLLVGTFLIGLQQNNLRDSEYLLAFWFFTIWQFMILMQSGRNDRVPGK